MKSRKTKITLNEIKIPEAFKATPPASTKIESAIGRYYYYVNNHYDRYNNKYYETKIIIDHSKHLLDGYTDYLVCKMFNKNQLKVTEIYDYKLADSKQPKTEIDKIFKKLYFDYKCLKNELDEAPKYLDISRELETLINKVNSQFFEYYKDISSSCEPQHIVNIKNLLSKIALWSIKGLTINSNVNSENVNNKSSEILCPFCQQPINKDEFRSEKNVDEFHISGLCQKCQDIVFGEK